MARNEVSLIDRARQIQSTFGTFRAARFMAKRGWSIEGALWILCRSERSRGDAQGMRD